VCIGGGGAEWIIPYVSVALISTTIHVQDFRDEAGDRKQGRTTFPVVAPEFSRQMTCAILLGWTFGLALFWPLDKVQVALYTMFGTYLAIRVLKQRTEYEDKVSLRIYMVSVIVSYSFTLSEEAGTYSSGFALARFFRSGLVTLISPA
jgi:1,4-dihydroxy-2-naphthoate octaprenyltransferase